jgi:catechol 2,3-dioxygenase-like lactoylglutathione lyase family enzyme
VATTFSHTNIVARDVERLGAFYTEVFGCVMSGPERDLAGEWLERGTGLPGARIRGIHLRVPGHGDDGPTLELFSVAALEPAVPSIVNRAGLMHIAFSVDDVAGTLDRIVAAGGEALGEIVEANVAGVGRADFVYTRDPEGNIVELLGWKEQP